jgi:3-oxoacyl-[acyl-carrier-protein] synthase II
MGLVTPFGVGLRPYWESAVAGESAVSRLEHFDPSGLSCQVAAYCRDEAFGSTTCDTEGEPRFVQFALTAGRAAWKDARMPYDQLTGHCGIYIGTSGEKWPLERFAQIAYESRLENGGIGLKEFVRQWQAKIKPGETSCLLPQYAAARLAREFSIFGPVETFNTACTSSAHAVGEAVRAIRRGDVDIAIAGGTECLVSQIGLHVFCPLGVLSRRNESPEKASRPFDLERDGFVLGEGAGIVVIENAEQAQKRGARILAELRGYGTSCDAYRITDEAPDGRGAILAMRRAIKDAGLATDEIGYINAHGTSTPMNDRIETHAVKNVFGAGSRQIPVSSVKSMIGHTISAAAAIELVTCVLALDEKVLPPTINYEFPDPECDLDYVPNQARTKTVDAILSNSFGFGGHNDCLVVSRFEQ